MRLPWKKAGASRVAKSLQFMTEAPETAADVAPSNTATLLEAHEEASSELGDLAKLPPFRPVVITLMRLFDREIVGADEIAHLMESDPTLMAELLALVNSPLFALPAPVTSPAQAVNLLGFDTVKLLATTLGMRSMMQNAPRTPVVRRFWLHSLAASTIAQDFARVLHLDVQTEYVNALLHDMGRLGLLAAYPEEYTVLALAAYDDADAILATEAERVGMTHCQAGEKLARAWRLPTSVQRAAAHHHHSSSALVHLACRLADDLQFLAIMRRDVRKPEETIAELAPESAELLIARLDHVSSAILHTHQTLDF